MSREHILPLFSLSGILINLKRINSLTPKDKIIMYITG